ncbi:MAG: LamG-like jellyroll fold domain-containing protein [Desulfocapsaceae bacterium]|nr:LamG-like jellyroll fold domain-containing protein [Desulfocapsaceae bacterium]
MASKIKKATEALVRAIGIAGAAIIFFTITELHVQAASGNAAQFTLASNSFIAATSSTELKTFSALTVEAWIKPDVAREWALIMGKQLNPSDGNPWYSYRLCKSNSGTFPDTVNFNIAPVTAGGEVGVTSTTVVQNNTWTHVAGVYDGATMKIYINGNLENTVAQTGDLKESDLAMYIGKAPWTNYNNFNGQMDELRVWNVARTQAQIQYAMNRSLVGNETGLVAYWPFNDAAGSPTADDASQYNHVGTLYNGAAIVADSTAPVNIDDLTTNNATGNGAMTQARYLVNLGFDGGQSVTALLAESGLYDYAKYRGNQSNWWVINDGSTANVAVTYGDVNVQGGSTPPPDFFGYKFKYPVSVTNVIYTDYSFADGGTFNGTPSLQYLSSLSGTWTTVAATWDKTYDSSFADGRKITYSITPNVPLDNIWGVRLHGDTSPSSAWDSSGWASVTELTVYGNPNFGASINLGTNLTQGGTPICSNNAWQVGAGNEIIDGDFDNSNEVWDVSQPSGDKFIGISWSTPQDHVGAIGFGITFNADGGWFIDTVDNPLKVQYTTDGTQWHDVANLNKGRYSADYSTATSLGYSYKGSWLFNFNSISGITGIRLIGLPGGNVGALGGSGYISIRELQVFQATGPGAFTFTDQTDVNLSTVIPSDAIAVSDIYSAVNISIPSCTGTNCEYQINDGTWTSDTGTVINGDTITVRQISSAGYSTQTDLVLNIGGVTDTFSVTTMAIPQHTLAVNKSGTGAGDVTGGGTYNYGTTQQITAAASTGSTFTGWSGDCAGTASPLDMLIDGNKTCTATFTLNQYTLTVNKEGTGSGTVGGSGSYPYQTPIQVTAVAATGSTFTGWSGDCYGTASPYVILVNSNKTCTATFTLNQYTVSASAGGNGSLNAGTTSPQTIDYNATTHFIFNAATGYHVAGILGCGISYSNTDNAITSRDETTAPITGDCVVSATFTLNTYTLTINKTGLGTVTSMPAGINCGTDCSESYNNGDEVTLTAIPARGNVFIGWSNDGCTGQEDCIVIMNDIKEISVVFQKKFPWTMFLPAVTKGSQ